MDSQMTNNQIIEQGKKLIQNILGLADVEDIEFNDIGWTSRVYLINNGQFVFKFPRTEDVKKEYIQEIAILSLLEGIPTDIQVPKVRWTHPNNDYLGYEGIVGNEFDQLNQSIDVAAKKNIGQAIGGFLKQLHSMDLDDARVMTIEDEIKEFQYKYGLCQAVIKSELTDEEQTKIKDLIENIMPSELLLLGGDPAPCHGDLGQWNIIVGENGNIGIIDFGDVGYYDRSKDFIGLENKETLDEALKEYGETDILRQKIAIRQKVLPILDLPFFVGKNDKPGIEKTLTKVKSAIK